MSMRNLYKLLNLNEKAESVNIDGLSSVEILVNKKQYNKVLTRKNNNDYNNLLSESFNIITETATINGSNQDIDRLYIYLENPNIADLQINQFISKSPYEINELNLGAENTLNNSSILYDRSNSGLQYAYQNAQSNILQYTNGIDNVQTTLNSGKSVEFVDLSSGSLSILNGDCYIDTKVNIPRGSQNVVDISASSVSWNPDNLNPLVHLFNYTFGKNAHVSNGKICITETTNNSYSNLLGVVSEPASNELPFNNTTSGTTTLIKTNNKYKIIFTGVQIQESENNSGISYFKFDLESKGKEFIETNDTITGIQIKYPASGNRIQIICNELIEEAQNVSNS